MIKFAFMLADSIKLDPLSPDLTLLLSGLPETHGVYAIRSASEIFHLSWTTNLRRRLTRLLHPDRLTAQRLSEQLAAQSAFVVFWVTGSSLETSIQNYLLALEFFPKDYQRRLRLRLPWFVTLTEDGFPRLMVTNRLSSSSAVTIGPFGNRDLAARFEEGILPLFQIRRCTEALMPRHDHPGCIYGEMSQCMRPCQLQVTADEYAVEVARVSHFLEAGPASALSSLTLARDQAAQQLDFEWASQLHKQIDRIAATQSLLSEATSNIFDFQGIALTPGVESESYSLRMLSQGLWRQSTTLKVSREIAASTSLDTRLRELLTSDSMRLPCPGSRLEHLALFSRWYQSHTRQGEWFAFNERQGIPFRKLARGISRLAKTVATPQPAT